MNRDDRDWLAERFEADRPHLRAVAYRMLGSASEADDAVQESWLRLSRADTSDVSNLSGWLTTVVSRVCLDMLRSRSSRREEPLDAEREVVARVDPEGDAVLADSVGSALLLVLETLAPAERLAFVLHDLFAVPFEEIAAIVGRSPAAARQLASRARRRVQGGEAPPAGEVARQRAVVDAFLEAARGGDVNRLLALLDPDVVLRSDAAAARAGAPADVRGPTAVAETFAGRAKAAEVALVGGDVGLVWAPGGRPQVAFDLVVEGGRIVEIEIVADRGRLAELDVKVL